MKKWSRKTKILTTIIILGIISSAFQPTDIYFLIKKNFTIFSETYENIALEYVDQVDPSIVMKNGLNAMLETLDPYTVYYDEAQNEEAEIFSRGNYAGIGIDAGYKDDQVVVIAPVEGGPADLIGIRAGDIILEIDGVPTEGLQPEEVQNLTMGEIGSNVSLKIIRYGIETPIKFEITRETIEIKNVTYSGHLGANSEFGIIRLSQFGMNAGDEIRSAISELQFEQELEGLILDLRDNPGGILGEAVSIIDKFIEPGISVVETRGRIAEYNQSYETQEPIFFDKPVIILMNEGSASASEVVAGALQDLDRAVILGERSFGKGLVQIVKPMPYNTSLKITISRYYTPSGRSIQSVAYTHTADNATINREDLANRIFRTRNGRPVKEGRGIEPDIEILSSVPSIIEMALLQQNSIFDFATQFESTNPDFNHNDLPDNIYQAFIEFLKNSDFDLELESEFLLNELAEKLGDIESASLHIAALRKSIEEEKSVMFNIHKAIIEKMLYLELIYRYKGETERTKAAFQFDHQLNQALSVLSESSGVEEILSGNN
jgi:carboxyl-terminal processing protease